MKTWIAILLFVSVARGAEPLAPLPIPPPQTMVDLLKQVGINGTLVTVSGNTTKLVTTTGTLTTNQIAKWDANSNAIADTLLTDDGTTLAYTGTGGISTSGTTGKITMATGTAPSNPTAGNILLYGDSGTGDLTCLKSTGASCLPGSVGTSTQYASTYWATTSTLGGVTAPTVNGLYFLNYLISGSAASSPNATLSTSLPAGSAIGTADTGTPSITFGTNLITASRPVAVGADNSVAGTVALANSGASAHTTLGSAATTSNTILGPATVIPDGHLISCATSSTTCTLTDGGTGGASPLDVTAINENEDFISGATGNGTIGKLGWAFSSAQSSAYAAPTWPAIGVWEEITGGSASTYVDLYLSPMLTAWSANAGWELKWRFKLVQTTNTRFYVGILPPGNAARNSYGCWLRYDTNAGVGDAAFKVECGDGSNYTVGATSYTVDTNYHVIDIKSTVAGQIIFTFDANAPQTISTNVPAQTNIVPDSQCGSDVTATEVRCALDFFGIKISSLSR